ncbi:MAG: limonene-1,2-epoxide hydrolase family protein [Acidimicrobiales bacterium]
MATRDELVALVETFWNTLYVERDLEAIGAMFTDDGFYTDVPIDDGGATGPRQITARLRIGFGPVKSFDHVIHRIVVDGDTVVTEHAETWHFDDEVSVTLPFVSVQEIHDGKFTLWRDYSNMNTLLDSAPAWWIEHIMSQPPVSEA